LTLIQFGAMLPPVGAMTRFRKNLPRSVSCETFDRYDRLHGEIHD
jgi:hypothetical protein